MRRMLRSRVSLVTCVVLTTLTLSGCEAYDLPLPGSPVDEDEAFEVTAEFRDVLDLVPRSPIKVNDVTVGEIVELRRVGWRAEAVLRIQEDVKLPENAIADIRQTSLLGEKYVALEEPPGQPSQGTLSDGDRLGLDQTGRNPELEEVLGALSMLLNGGGVGQIQTIITEVNKIFSGRQDRARHVLGELETLVGGLDEQKQDIIGAMEAMNSLAETLNAEKQTVTEALDTLGPAVGVLADQREALMNMLDALDRLGRVGTRVINASKESLLSDLRHLAPTLREVADVDDQLAESLGLAISFPFPIESNDIVHGDYANTEIVFSMDLQNLYQNFQSQNGGGLPELPLSGLPRLPDLPGRNQLPDLRGDRDQQVPQLPGLGGLGSLGRSVGVIDPAASSLVTLMGGDRR